ncbi:hypothetical protein BDR26DRAFT_869197 [Obelidium mucronatum]|nr:hypothetical protein BDR26DRAFT_869197 [Obelidium mucronatum]
MSNGPSNHIVYGQLKSGMNIRPVKYILIGTQIQVTNSNVPIPYVQILHDSTTAIETLFSKYTSCNPPHRLYYAMAGYVFQRNTDSPPFGGAIKSNPGYLQFEGSTALELLGFLVSEAFQAYWGFKGRDAVDLVAEAANRVYGMQKGREKDFLDELMMQGMRKAGHIEWVGQYMIPVELRHVKEKRIKPVKREEGVT